MSEERIKISLPVIFVDEIEFILSGLKHLAIDTLVIEGDFSRTHKKLRLSQSRNAETIRNKEQLLIKYLPRIKEHGFKRVFLVHHEFPEEFYKALGELLLRQNTVIEELCISSCALTASKLVKFSQELGECNNLSVLDLRNNKLDSSAAAMVGRIVTLQGEKKNEIVWLNGLRGEQPPDGLQNRGLAEVNLDSNMIEDLGAEELCKFLGYDNWLRSLSLRNNKIEAKGCVEFVKMLGKNDALLSLDLRDNPGFNRRLSQAVLEKLSTNMDKFKKGFRGSTLEFSSPQKQVSPSKKLGSDSKKFLSEGMTVTLTASHIPPTKEAKPIENMEMIEENKSDHGKKLSPPAKLKEPKAKREAISPINKLKTSAAAIKPQKKSNRCHIRDIDPTCQRCINFDKMLLKAESRIMNLCIENAKLRTALSSVGFQNNSWAAIQSLIPQETEVKVQITPLVTAANLLGERGHPDQKEIDPQVLNRIDVLVAELTRLMDCEYLPNRDKTMHIQQNLTNSASGIYNNTVNLEQPGTGEQGSGDLQIIESGVALNEPSRIEAINPEADDDPNDNTDDVNFLPNVDEDSAEDPENSSSFLNDRILEISSPER